MRKKIKIKFGKNINKGKKMRNDENKKEKKVKDWDKWIKIREKINEL